MVFQAGQDRIAFERYFAHTNVDDGGHRKYRVLLHLVEVMLQKRVDEKGSLKKILLHTPLS